MGKVWCMANADVAPIRPGDLLTTSSISGHCRRVTEPARAFGAVIGKALTALASGRGLVRVLVSPR
jgi:NAD(P)H-hydrate repair Nnr-like enzyme with NAD(P)H-hydrate dehydratase domain